MNQESVDEFLSPLYAEMEKVKSRLANEMDVNERTRINQVKLEEQLKIANEKNVTLEAKQRELTEKLDAKETIIKVLTDGADRIANNRTKDETIKKLQAQNAKLTRQLEQMKNDNKSKRKRKKTEPRFIGLI